jgi:hypothetical protein
MPADVSAQAQSRFQAYARNEAECSHDLLIRSPGQVVQDRPFGGSQGCLREPELLLDPVGALLACGHGHGQSERFVVSQVQ